MSPFLLPPTPYPIRPMHRARLCRGSSRSSDLRIVPAGRAIRARVARAHLRCATASCRKHRLVRATGQGTPEGSLHRRGGTTGHLSQILQGDPVVHRYMLQGDPVVHLPVPTDPHGSRAVGTRHVHPMVAPISVRNVFTPWCHQGWASCPPSTAKGQVTNMP